MKDKKLAMFSTFKLPASTRSSVDGLGSYQQETIRVILEDSSAA